MNFEFSQPTDSHSTLQSIKSIVIYFKKFQFHSFGRLESSCVWKRNRNIKNNVGILPMV